MLTVYVQDTLQTLNGITAFMVAQSLIFTYWSQGDDFKDNVKYGGHKFGVAMILLFGLTYAYALYIETGHEIAILELAKDANQNFLVGEAWSSLYYRWGTDVVFTFISLLSVLRYFAGRYSSRWDQDTDRQ